MAVFVRSVTTLDLTNLTRGNKRGNSIRRLAAFVCNFDSATGDVAWDHALSLLSLYDSSVRRNFNVVYWWVELFFPQLLSRYKRIEIIIEVKANFYKEIVQFTILVAIIGNKISKYFFLTSLSQIPYISTRQTYTSSKFSDGPLEQWWGRGVGKKPKKHSCKGKYQEKKFKQKEGKEKKFMQKDGRIVTFSERLSFRNQQYYQAQYE